MSSCSIDPLLLLSNVLPCRTLLLTVLHSHKGIGAVPMAGGSQYEQHTVSRFVPGYSIAERWSRHAQTLFAVHHAHGWERLSRGATNGGTPWTDIRQG